MIIPEDFLLAVLKNGFTKMANNSQALMDLFFFDSPLDISRLQSVLLTPKKLTIIHGFPPAGVKDSLIGITLGEQDEDDQFVGEAGQYFRPESIGGATDALFKSTVFGTMFMGTWRITVYSSNADLAIKLSYMVKYILLTYRDYLTQAGLLEQHISMADFEPIPEYLPDIVYVRAIMFKCKTLDTFKEFGRESVVAGFDVEAESILPTG